MKTILFCAAISTLVGTSLICACNSKSSTDMPDKSAARKTEATVQYGGFPNQVEWGKHLVAMGGCSDCHTPKSMTGAGLMPDTSMFLAGHPANVPPPDVDRKELEKKGLALTNDLTTWVGPWGISYSANLTPSESGIGNWNEGEFLNVFKNGKFNGLQASRNLLPPMDGVAQGLRHAASDNELKAMFAYLKTLKPVNNAVPTPVPPENLARK